MPHSTSSNIEAANRVEVTGNRVSVQRPDTTDREKPGKAWLSIRWGVPTGRFPSTRASLDPPPFCPLPADPVFHNLDPIMKPVPSLLVCLCLCLFQASLHSAEEEGRVELFNGRDLSNWVNVNCAQAHAARPVNTTQVVANWLIGREIVEEEPQGAHRAAYAKRIVPSLAFRLLKKGVRGYGELTLRLCRQLYLTYPDLPGLEICYSLRNKSGGGSDESSIVYALRNQSPNAMLLVPQASEAQQRDFLTHLHRPSTPQATPSATASSASPPTARTSWL